MTPDYKGPERRAPNDAYKEVAREAVAETFRAVGADIDHPIELQKDFAHLRGHRIAREQVGQYVRRVLITVSITSGLAGVWLLLKDQLPWK